MKKYLIKYTNIENNEVWYAGSPNGDGRSYCLTKAESSAFDVYGTKINSMANVLASRIFYDTMRIDGLAFHLWYTYEIVEIEVEPTWYFDMQYYIKRFYGIHCYERLPEGFKVEGDEYHKPLWEEIVINDLNLKGLKRLINWLKENRKPKFKMEPSQLKNIQLKVEEKLNKYEKN